MNRARTTAAEADALERELRPVRDELLRRAHADADRMLTAARRRSRDDRARAAEEAAAITARAVALGRTRAADQLTARRRRAARDRRSKLLAARQRAYAQWRRAATAAVLGLRDGPGYPDIRNTLRATITRVLGPRAELAEDPAGGIVGRADGKVLDLRLETLAARAMDRVEADIDGLWA